MLKDLSQAEMDRVVKNFVHSPAEPDMKESVLCDHLYNILMVSSVGFISVFPEFVNNKVKCHFK